MEEDEDGESESEHLSIGQGRRKGKGSAPAAGGAGAGGRKKKPAAMTTPQKVRALVSVLVGFSIAPPRCVRGVLCARFRDVES